MHSRSLGKLFQSKSSLTAPPPPGPHASKMNHVQADDAGMRLCHHSNSDFRNSDEFSHIEMLGCDQAFS